MPMAAASSITEIAIETAIAAADVICAVYDRPIHVVTKEDGSPVTEADAAAEAVIIKHLEVTGLPTLGEESVAAGVIPVLGERYFVVDPLDGTKEFIKRNGEFTVNIALVENGRSIMGVVLAPATGDLFVGDVNGAWSGKVVAGKVVDRRPIKVAPSAGPHIVASRSHGHAALAQLREIMGVESDVSIGSSLKFCLVARGDAQLYPRFTPTCEWDTAAGQAVLEAAGGALLTLDGAPLRYGKGELKYLNPYFVAAASEELALTAAELMQRLIPS
ncbi:3'(2'),5'-bisphosphate nucleotidase CysQ [uncultured Devosia sp.]|uniref:3'(2'),5'-bisphosphate nucleotidase CysQ n=1 Tax=uncultured Devosia sp. TaxID=211434 RepID=UPI00260C5490|nr:3'(2'),5'-bisphosphate nucleotidase CysQ [uncultured Devosia sp.]